MKISNLVNYKNSIFIKVHEKTNSTKSLLYQIRQYVQQRIFPSKVSKLDKETIKHVFNGTDGRANEILKMLNGEQIHVPYDKSDFDNHCEIMKTIQHSDQKCCIFKNLFIYAIDWNPTPDYGSELECSISLAPLYKYPITFYRKAAEYNFNEICDEAQQKKCTTTNIPSNVVAKQSPAFTCTSKTKNKTAKSSKPQTVNYGMFR